MNENTLLCPMLFGPLSLPRVSTVFYPDIIVLLVNPRAKRAFDNLYQAIKRVSGKLVFIDNRFALHSREKFLPQYDNNGTSYRWLQCLFITKSLWGFRGFKKIGSRVFDPSVSNV